MSYFEQIDVTDTDGSQIDPSTKQHQQNVEDVLGQILKQLKIMNLHMATMTDNYIRETEVE